MFEIEYEKADGRREGIFAGNRHSQIGGYMLSLFADLVVAGRLLFVFVESWNLRMERSMWSLINVDFQSETDNRHHFQSGTFTRQTKLYFQVYRFIRGPSVSIPQLCGFIC